MLGPSVSSIMTIDTPGDMPIDERGQRSLAAIVLTDAVGFSARMSEDEDTTLVLIHNDLKSIESFCQQFEGRVIKSTGDGLLMYFVSAIQAVKCSLEIQRQLPHHHQHQHIEKPLQHRIGVHLGDVFFKDADVMGNGVNIAARLQSEAYPGGICISQIVYEVVKSKLNVRATYAGPLKLKNIQDPQPAYHLHPHGEAVVPAPVPPSPPVETPEPAPLSPSAHPNPRDRLQPGSKVGGRYTVQRILGQGGFGRSYLVEDSQRFGERCVLKEFFPSSTSTRSLQKALDLFKREAKTLYQISHPQIPTFMACFTQGKRLFIVQEYINGVTYAQLLKQRKRDGRCFTPEEVAQWLIHMLQVLDYLHGLNVVHRDISPDNVIYSSDRKLPVLIDFGLVNDAMNSILSEDLDADADADADDDDDRPGPVTSATLVGKFGYSPPEQIQLGQCFPSSDLYALGVTAIVLLTGKYPRELMNQASMEWDWQRHLHLSPAFIKLLNKLTFPKPNGRFQSAQEVLEAATRLVPHASSPLPQAFRQPIDLSLDHQAAPIYDAPLQSGLSTARDAEFVNQCRHELTRSIGPMASVVLEDVLEQYPDASPHELVALLAAQLSNGQQADDFTSRMIANSSVIISQEQTRWSRTMPPVSTPSTQSSQPQTASPEFIHRCRQALSQSIGPMADFLIEETLADYPNLSAQDLVLQLASEIPDMAKAREFQQRLL